MIESLKRVLAEHPFVRGLDETHVAFITGCAENVRVRAGDILFEEGDEANATWLVRTGRVDLCVHRPGRGPAVIESVDAGEVVGWSWLFPPYQWHFGARAAEDVRALRLDGTCLRRKCEDDHDLGYAVAKRLLLQVHKRLERARMQALDLYA
jgi:CRP-like cAMP-binding protein